MKMKKKDEDIKFSIDKVIGLLKDGSDWNKAVMLVSWFDNAPTLDIRNVNLNANPPKVGKGISLSNEEADKLVSVLLDSGYGSMDDLERAVKSKRTIFTVPDKQEECLNIDIK